MPSEVLDKGKVLAELDKLIELATPAAQIILQHTELLDRTSDIYGAYATATTLRNLIKLSYFDIKPEGDTK